MIKKNNMIIKLFYISFGLLPFFTSICLGINNLFYPESHYLQDEMKHKFISLLGIVAIFSLCFYIFKYLDVDKIKKWLPLVVFIVAIIPRLLVLLTGKYIVPFSDFGNAHQTAIGNTNAIDYHKAFVSWLYYALFVKNVYKITYQSFQIIQLLNVLLSSVSCVLLFKLTYRITANTKISLASGMLYALYLPSIIYNLILSPEIPAIFLSLIVLHIMIIFINLFKIFEFKKSHIIKTLLMAIVIGIILGILEFLKPLSLIFIIAFFITLLLKIFIEVNSKNYIFKKSVYFIIVFLILILFYTITTLINKNYVEKTLNVETPDNSFANFLSIGLDPYGEGQIHLTDRTYKKLLDEYNYDYEKINEKIYNIIIEKISDNPKQMLVLLKQKIRWAWQDDTRPISYYINMSDEVSKDNSIRYFIQNLLFTSGTSTSQIQYIFLMGLSLVGVLIVYKKHTNNLSLFFISLYQFGFTCMLLLSEAQSRYKCMITPLVCILAGIGLNAILEKNYKKIENHA